MSDRSERAVAIVGLGAVLPDAPNARAFRDNIWSKKYSITEVPADRWNVADYFDPDPSAPAKTYSRIGAWVRGYQFDWKRWRIPPTVAGAMDQGQQWGVTIAAEALEDYGWPQRPLDTERTGVILGNAMAGERHYLTTLRIEFPEYRRLLVESKEFAELPADVRSAILARWSEVVMKGLPEITEDTMPGELSNILAGRVANVLNLRGPNFTADAACASTLAALDAAVNLLLAGHCDAVLTGGIDRNMAVNSFVKFSKIGALSASGSRPFGDGADGFVMGEGAAAFLLKRLADAERDGDKIYAVIRGVGASSDGKGKGITAPNPIGQQLSTQRAWDDAGIDPATATLVEAHGTSTKVGDVVEVESLASIFKGAPKGSIALGSAKSNIGHLKAAAGAAGLLKAVWAVHEKCLPPTLNARPSNPGIDFASTPFAPNHELREWKTRDGLPRRCGVSAYGFGGTNFHVVLEEHVPGALTRGQRPAQVSVPASFGSGAAAANGPTVRPPLRGLVVIGADSVDALRARVNELAARVKDGHVPPVAPPAKADLAARERIAIDYEDGKELLERLHKAQKGLATDAPATWRAFQAQGVFRGSGPAPGKVAFLFTGQGSQYVNMGRDLASADAVAMAVFEEADRVLEPILGRKLTSYIFVDRQDPEAVKQAEEDLKQTAITQPAVLSMDTAMCRLLAEYGIEPDMVMGHSLGEYGALVSAEVLSFAEALEAAAARGREMTKVSFGDNGAMAAVMAPISVVSDVLEHIDGYVVPANLNARGQVVIGGETPAVERAVDAFNKKGYPAQRLPVSHAFHTKIVAPAAGPLRKVLERFDVRPPKRRLVGNVEADFYPSDPEAIRDLLCRQIASPVRWVEGVERLYAAGARAFVEVGPKRALKGFVDDILADKTDITSLCTNRPRPKELAAFNQALAGLYAAGYGVRETAGVQVATAPVVRRESAPVAAAAPAGGGSTLDELRALLTKTLDSLPQPQPQIVRADGPYDRNDVPQGSIVISGTGLGLPGVGKHVMDPTNAARILAGEQLVGPIPAQFRTAMARKRITRLVKSADGSGHFELIEDEKDVIKLAGRPGAFDLTTEYGVPAKLVEALDATSQLALAAGLDALREAGIPLVQTYKKTTTGKYLPERWMLPEALRDETGVVFASAFPGFDRFADETKRYYTFESRRAQRRQLAEVLDLVQDATARAEIARRIAELDALLDAEAYTFDRRFLLRLLTMGHSQFAEYVGARGPNTHVNAACASTAHAISLAEDWIKAGRCRRVVVLGGDNVTSDNLLEWIGAGFVASGVAATDERVEDAALPFDRRRHGTLLGMGACALVVESQDAVEERGMRGIVELLSSETANSAFHATRLDVNHVASTVESLVASAERRFGVNRKAMAPQTVFVSHETFTPARGGSAAAEITALRHVFGAEADRVIIANTKGFTGHAMGVGVEDVIAVKILEHQVVPPVPNLKEPDPDLGALTLSKGGHYPVEYAIHLAAGFGSQIALTLTRRIPGAADRVEDRVRHQEWLAKLSGYPEPMTEVVNRVLRVAAQGAPAVAPAARSWPFGLGPVRRTPFAGDLRREQPPAAVSAPSAAAGSPVPMALVSAQAAARPLAPEVPAVPVAVRSVPVPAAAAPVVAPAAPAPVREPVVERVLAIVAEKTGYPPDMLDLELDLEADLGVDTVKQAETFAAVREAYDIQRQENLRLRDFPTLRSVVGFVYQFRPDLKPSEASPALAGGVHTPLARDTRDAAGYAPDGTAHLEYPARHDAGSVARSGDPARLAAAPAFGTTAAAAPPAPVQHPSSVVEPVAQKVLEIVSEKTGYPSDMLEMDLDLEADLGVDTVKQAETFAAVREAYGIPRQENLKLRDFPTLRSVVGFVYQFRPDLKPTEASPALAGGVHAPLAPRYDAGSVARSGDPARLDADAARHAVETARASNASLTSSRHPEGGFGTAPVGSSGGSPVAPSAGASEDSAANPVVKKVLEIVAEKTGYPQDMLELDLDLEADLGVDTVKQAETFAAVREAYGIARQENLKLRDFPTLRSVVGFVYQFRPDLKPAEAAPESAGGVHAPLARDTAPEGGASLTSAAHPVVQKVLEIVAEKTGYPQDMLELDLDLEADLGVDTVKQAETFAAVREAYGIARQENLKLRDFPTLRSVVGFVYQFRPDLEPVETAPGPADGVHTSLARDTRDATRFAPDGTAHLEYPARHDAGSVARSGDPARRYDAPAPAHGAAASVGHPEAAPEGSALVAQPAGAPQGDSAANPVVKKVLEIVAEKTGYPEDMLELDLDLEADLGVDTVKQAETFAAVREAYDIARQENLKLRDFPTLRSVVGFVYQFRPDLKPVEVAPGPAGGVHTSLAPRHDDGPVARSGDPARLDAARAASRQQYTIEDADKMPRRVPVPSLRPALQLCKPTGVALAAGTRVVVTGDEGGVAQALADALVKRGVSVLALDGATTTEEVTARLNGWLAEGPICGVFWLPALDVEPAIEAMDLAAFREANRRRVKNLHAAMRALYDSVSASGTFLVSATRMGGLLGQTPEGATAPLGGAVCGFTKAYKRERMDALVKVVDFAPGVPAAEVAEALVAEALSDPGIVEVGRHDDLRWTITLEERPAQDGRPGLALNKDSVFVVTGAAGGITSAIVADLAGASGGMFYLLDLVAEPRRDDAHIALLRQDRNQLKLALIEEARAKGERPTPVQIDKQIMATERSEAALRAIESVEAAGGRVLWRSANLLDGPAVAAIVEEIEATHGRIDVLVHAGGIEISRKLSEKEAREFDLVFDIKADGFFSLLKAAGGMPIGATVVFSSIAGRFGNQGQTDYSAANALLCAMSSALHRARPQTRTIAIDWTAWGGIGMATRGSIPQIMAAAGITMLPPESGIPTVRRELVAGGGSGELVVAGTLGVMMAEFDATGGLDSAKLNATLAGRERPLLMVGHVKAARLYGGLAAETTLDPKQQPFLFDHQIDGVPVLPGVMGTETFAELASVLCPGFRLAAVESEAFLAPFKFHRNQPATLQLSAVAQPAGIGEVLVSAVLRSIVQPRPELPAQERVHFKAAVRMRREALDTPKLAFKKPGAKALAIGRDAIYGVYFHGPAYQVIEKAGVDEASVVALMADGLGPNACPAEAEAVSAPRLLELLFQAAGLWLLARRQTMALPTGLDAARFYRQPEEAKGKRLYALIDVREDGAAFDGRVVDEKGFVYAEVIAYRTVSLPEKKTLQA